jgi:hypothetical protein
MTDAEAKNMIARYAVSWYGDVDRIPIERVTSSHGIAHARTTPLVEAMQENIEQAKKNRDGIRARYEEAQLDGLFDVDMLEAAGKKVRGDWIEAIDVQRGDRARCIAELRHWREYLVWAMSQEKQPAPPIAPDSRLPVEREVGEDDGDEQVETA